MISQLRLLNFRCFDSLSVDFPPQGAIIVGANALGKTSILEAVCVLIRLHSPRSARLGKMIQVGSTGFGIAGECWGSSSRVRFHSKTGLEMNIDGETVPKQSRYLQSGGLVVWMGNDDLELVRGAGRNRRRYLDFIGCQLDPHYREHMNRYQRVLKMRNLLLKDRQPREREIMAYTELLVQHGEFLTTSRRQLVQWLEPEVQASQGKVSACCERVTMEYISGAGDDMMQNLEMTRDRERRVGQTVVGPHRDDIRLLINGMEAVDFASEGQQRTLALAMKMAQGELLQNRAGRMPVYLLDDIFGELDGGRRNALMQALPERAQKLITTTNIDWLNGEMETLEISSLQS